MSNHEDSIKLIIVFVVLVIAFPTIGITVLNSILSGMILGIVAAVFIGIILWFFWYKQ